MLPDARSRFAVKRKVVDVSLIWLHVIEGGGGGGLPVKTRYTCVHQGNR